MVSHNDPGKPQTRDLTPKAIIAVHCGGVTSIGGGDTSRGR